MSSPNARIAAAAAVGLGPNSNWAQINSAQKRQAELAAAHAATDRASQQANAAKAAAELTITRNKNEATQRKNETELGKQQTQLTTESKNQADSQKEREKMVRTFQSRRRGRAALRINLGSNSGSSYEGSSGININL